MPHNYMLLTASLSQREARDEEKKPQGKNSICFKYSYLSFILFFPPVSHYTPHILASS